MLRLTNIKKDYKTASETVHALKGVSLSFRKNEFVSILGPSGCGKTTMLNIIGGLDHYTSGDLVIGGKSTKAYTSRDWDVYRNHRIGFIFQSYNLIPHQTVLGNVELALTIAGINKEERIARAKRALDRVGLAGQYNKRPNQLSGGQCQRVAIARALVNDPEILLADEPTGALDTVTSKQIMELIKEISGERLVIMVTHNPELADEYSSRIIRLLDGEVIEDTNPYAEADEIADVEAELAAQATATEVVEDTFTETVTETATVTEIKVKTTKKTQKKPKKEKAKMSFFTSFMLSARNLLSKKGRTTMVGFAGSIGIIGIAMVLAFSGGISGYIEAMQDDMLSGNPISITETAYDLEALTGMMGNDSSFQVGTPDKDKKPGNVYISSLIEYLATMESIEEEVTMENEITEEYVKYVLAMEKDKYSAMTLRYGIDLAQSIYTDFRYSTSSSGRVQSVKSIVDTYTSILGETEFSDYVSYVPMLVPQFTQAPNSKDYILSQYDLVGEGSRVATEANEIMLVIDEKDEISDLLLAMLGYYTQQQFQETVVKATEDKYNGDVYKASFTYEELLNKSLYWYPNDSIYTKADAIDLPWLPTAYPQECYQYNYIYNSDTFKDGLELKVVGILKPKDDIKFGCLSSGVYYTEALTKHILTENADSTIVNDANDNTLPKYSDDFIDMLEAMINMGKEPNDEDWIKIEFNEYTIFYAYTYTSWWYGKNQAAMPEGAIWIDAMYGKEYGAFGFSYAGLSMSFEDMLGSIISSTGSNGSDGSSTKNTTKENFIRSLGGKNIPNVILIYPKSFDEMYMVTDYLEIWNTGDIGNEECLIRNDDGTPKLDEKGNKMYGVMINGTPYLADRPTIKATNTIELIIGLMKTLVDIVTWALVGFTSVSLVVSTVMIGIITYVSVVERIKEIGVIRSLGGRKKDVANLFNAEAFIIGLLAGVLGIAVTYLVSLIVNLALKNVIGYSHIAALPWWQALLLIALSVGLTCLSGIIPASSAARKDPVIALRTE